MEKDPCQRWHVKSLFIAAVFVVLIAAPSGPARADCESAGAVGAAIDAMNQSNTDNLNLFIEQEVAPKTTVTPDGTGGFAPNLMRTAYNMLSSHTLEFFKNIYEGLTKWASNDWLVALKGMTMELHAAQVDQTYRLGWLIDSQLLMENQLRYQKYINEGHRRYAPSELACEIDTVGPGLARSYQISRALNHGFMLDNLPRRNNIKDGPSADGKASDTSKAWAEYVKYFCDNTMGDMGCSVPGSLAGRHRDLPVLLWGAQQTIDPSNKENVRTMQAALRYFIDPIAPDPVAPKAVETAGGHQSILERRSEQVYINTIYNTLGAMLSERIGGSGINAQLMRTAAGVPIANASEDASYRELTQAFIRDRYFNPYYMVRLIGDPAQVGRELNTLGAMRLQTLNDIYRRSEERLFMESAGYGRELNEQMPGASRKDVPFKSSP